MLVARAGLSPVMVGRARELMRLQGLVDARGPHVALIRGEAGVGKTRLVAELLAGLPAGLPVLSAQAEEGAMGRPYQLVVEAVGPLVAAWTRVPPELRHWEDPLGVLLAPVAPQLGCADRAYRADELARAGTELVRHLVGRGPAVVVFEDLHWADAESLGLFQRLAATHGLPVLLVGSYRPEDLDRRHVTDLIGAVERQRQVEHVVLGRLSVNEVGAFVSAVRDAAVSYATAEALHQRTGGNPFFLEELLVAAGDAGVDTLADRPLPVTLMEAVLGHLEGLSDEQRRVVDAAAVLGQRIAFDMLAAVTGLGEDDLIGVLRELVGQGLIVEEGADLFSFRHALTREAVASRLLARERRRLHEKSLVALEEVGSDDWAALAHHAAGAERWDEMVAAARRGATAYLRAGATYQALRLAEAALSEADADQELLELATRAAWSVGLSASALERAEQWRRMAEGSDDPADLTRALRVLARLRWELGDGPGHRAAVEAARRAGQALPPGEERAWVANLVAESSMLAFRGDDALRWADEALSSAGPAISPELRASALVNKGSALVMMDGRGAEGEQVLLEGLAAAIACEDHHSALRAIHNLAHLVFRTWEPDRSAALLEQMGALIDRGGRRDWTGSWHLLRATFQAHVVGDLVTARLEAEAGDSQPWGAKRCWAKLTKAELAHEAGDDRLAQSLLAELIDPSGSVPTDPEEQFSALMTAVRVAARSQPPADTQRQLTDIVDSLASADVDLRGVLSDAWHHALVAAVAGDLAPDVVRDLVERAGVRPPSPEQADLAWPDHLRGALAAAEGDLHEAVAAYRSAVAGQGGRRSPPAAADAHLGAARALLALGRTDDARQEAGAAATLLARWPGWRRDDCDALLRRLGASATGAGGAGGRVASGTELSRREQEIAALVTEGLTNGEIGARLYISTKTVSVHVSNILRKLGMTNRTEVAAWVAGRDATAP